MPPILTVSAAHAPVASPSEIAAALTSPKILFDVI
jgi:hypothetical protein